MIEEECLIDQSRKNSGKTSPFDMLTVWKLKAKEKRRPAARNAVALVSKAYPTWAPMIESSSTAFRHRPNTQKKSVNSISTAHAAVMNHKAA